MCVFFDSIFLSLTLSFLRGVVQAITLERYLFLPFLAGLRGPSSEKLTGPVQFPVSSPLSRLNCCALVRKWVSLFGISCPYCANVMRIQPNPCVHSHTRTHRRTHIHHGGPAFWLKKNSQCMAPNMARMNLVWMIYLWSAGLLPLPWVWFKHSHSAILACRHVRLVIQYIKVIVI